MPTLTKAQKRLDHLLPQGNPLYVRIYDNGEPGDRYTVVFTGRYRHQTGGEFWYLGMSAAPFHPQGIGQHGSSPYQIDRPHYGHLGKKITWAQLPEDCRKCTLATYKELWGLK